MVCGPKIHPREGSPLPRDERKRWLRVVKMGFLDRRAVVLCAGSVLEAHTVILGSGSELQQFLLAPVVGVRTAVTLPVPQVHSNKALML